MQIKTSVKQLKLSIKMTVILLFLMNSSTAIAVEYSFGVVPQFEARKLYRIWKPILEVLEQRTGYQFTMQGTESIPDFEQEFLGGKFDFAYMNPWHSLVAFESQGYIPLVRDGTRRLKGILVVRKNSLITQLTQLQGKTIAFPAPNALGASLLMRAELSHLHGITIHPLYVGTHSSAYLNVILKQTDAAGGVLRTLQQQEPIIQDLLRIIYETQSIAPHPISVHPRVPKKVREQVLQAFLAMKNDPEQKKLLAKIPMPDPISATITDYLPLKKLGLEGFYVKN